MQFYGILLLASVTKASFTYQDFLPDTANGKACSACTKPTMNVMEINKCLDAVPSTCRYTVKAVAKSPAGVTDICTGNAFGFGFKDFITTLRGSANITSVQGKATLTLNADQTGDCTFDTYSTNTEANHCQKSTNGDQTGSITFNKSQGSLELSDFKLKYVDLINTSPTTSVCGTALKTVEYVDGATATLELKGESDLGKSGVAPLLQVSIVLFTMLGSLYFA